MVRQLVTAVVLILFTIPSGSLAQTVCGPQDYDSETSPNFDCPSPDESSMTPDLNPPPSVPVKVAESITAAWDGALVHRDRLIEYGMKVRGLRRLRWADRLHLAERYRLELEHLEELHRIRSELLEAQVAAQRQRALAAERRAGSAGAWYRSVWFGLVLGLATAALLVVGAAYLVTSI